MESAPLPSSYGLTSGTFQVRLDPSNPAARPSSFVYAECDAHLFQTQFEDAVGAPLKMVRSYVLDSNPAAVHRCPDGARYAIYCP